MDCLIALKLGVSAHCG